MTNAAAIGYMILAAKLDDEITKQLESLMVNKMDLHTEREAEEAYRNFF